MFRVKALSRQGKFEKDHTSYYAHGFGLFLIFGILTLDQCTYNSHI
jgi:hypothetical protein